MEYLDEIFDEHIKRSARGTAAFFLTDSSWLFPERQTYVTR
jgi:hypothetical protein